jgi:hypothetical protein
MSMQYVNVGRIVNDGTGDDLYSAFTKINNNFSNIDFISPQNNTASNIGTGVGIYKEKIGSDIRLKTLVNGPGISITSEDADLIISNTNNSITTIQADTGEFVSPSLSSTIYIKGGDNITTTVQGNNIVINSNSSLVSDTAPSLGGNLNLNGHNITGSGTISASHFYGPLNGNVTGNLVGNVSGNLSGNVFGNVNGVNVSELANNTYNFDFGYIKQPNIDSNIDFINWLKYNLSIDLGSFSNPQTIIGGSITGNFNQVNSDWYANSGPAEILNKPNIPPPLPADASGYLHNNGSGTLSWAAISSGGGLVSRATVSVTTSSLAAGASTISSFSIAKGYALYSITTSSAAWVTVYSNTAASTADSSRSITTDPTPGSGIMAEAITTSASTSTQHFTPAVLCYNDESPVNSSIPIKIYNNGVVSQTITVTLTYLQLEA